MPCSLHLYVGSFSYTSHADFVFMWGVSLTHPVLVSFSFFFFISCCLYFSAWSFSYSSRASIIFMKEFLLHIPCWLFFFFFLSLFFFFSFFFFILGVSLTHTVLGSFVLFFFFFFISGVSLTHPMLDSFSSWEFPRTATQRFKKAVSPKSSLFLSS